MSLNNSQNSPTNAKIQSFLESLRASRTLSPKSDKAENSFAGSNPFKEIQAKKEIEHKRIESFHQARQREWSHLYSAKEQEKTQKIESIRQQLQNLVKNLKKLDTNLQKAVETPIIQAGTYHESFLEHLQKTIQMFNKNVNSTNTWLELFNSRSSKKGYYHSMARSRGTSFTQSNERNLATSVG